MKEKYILVSRSLSVWGDPMCGIGTDGKGGIVHMHFAIYFEFFFHNFNINIHWTFSQTDKTPILHLDNYQSYFHPALKASQNGPDFAEE